MNNTIKTFFMVSAAFVAVGIGILAAKYPNDPISPISQKRTDYYEIDIIIIDNCEYIRYATSGICHKGDCSNPIHKQ